MNKGAWWATVHGIENEWDTSPKDRGFIFVSAAESPGFPVLPYLPKFFQTHVLDLVMPSNLTLCDLMDCSPPGTSVHGIL